MDLFDQLFEYKEPEKVVPEKKEEEEEEKKPADQIDSSSKQKLQEAAVEDCPHAELYHTMCMQCCKKLT